MKRSVVVDVCARLLLPSGFVLSLYLLFAGHNQPGGGFVGGLVAGAAITLEYVAGGLSQVRAVFRLKPWSILGTGLAIGASSAVVPLFLGGQALEQGYSSITVPVLGTIKVTSALVFDAGVYVIVIGTVLMAFEGLGEDAPPTVGDHE